VALSPITSRGAGTLIQETESVDRSALFDFARDFLVAGVAPETLDGGEIVFGRERSSEPHGAFACRAEWHVSHSRESLRFRRQIRPAMRFGLKTTAALLYAHGLESLISQRLFRRLTMSGPA
jgi:hypothetical protein